MPGLTTFGDIPDNTASSSPQSIHREGSESPFAPPYSPITPVMATATLAPASVYHAEEYSPPAMQRPAAVPISESDNPDAIALRSTISVLQIQRQRAVRDLQTLERQKAIATADPEKFAHELMSGGITSSPDQGILGYPVSGLSTYTPGLREDSTTNAKRSEFGVIPAPQSVVRTPPVNWTKYQIRGESLDRLHEEQQSRPTLGGPEREVGPARSLEHVIAAPYRPWEDTLSDSPARSRNAAKNEL
ncbi:hypothetical protein MMC13_005697 [Lambiella insularis]|nr:hypothetical protein [Lambiella insularis]